MKKNLVILLLSTTFILQGCEALVMGGLGVATYTVGHLAEKGDQNRRDRCRRIIASDFSKERKLEEQKRAKCD